MRKSLLVLIALLFGVGGGMTTVKARTILDMSTATPSENASWNAETNTFTWTAENAYIVIPGLSGDLTGAYLDFTISAACHLDIVYTDETKTEGGWNGYGRFGSGGSKTQDLGFMAGAKINSVKEVRICSQSASGSLTVTSVSYYFPLKLNYDASGVATVPFYSIITSGGVTFDKATGTVTNTDGTGYLAIELPNSGIDLSSIKRINVTYTGTEDIWGGNENRVLESLEIPGVNTWQGSRYNCDYTNYSASSSNVTSIRWNAGGKIGESLTITAIMFTSEFTSCSKAGEKVLNTLTWNKNPGEGSDVPGWNMNVSTDTYYGDGQGNVDHYVNLDGYSELRIYRETNAGFRAFFFNSTGDGVVQIDASAATWNAEEKYWSLNLSSVSKWDGKIALKTIKSSGYGTYDVVKNIVVYKTPAAGSAEYLITGKGLLDAATTALLADANVTSIDATGMTNVTATTLSPANPNCLFIANAGKLSNTKNVIVSGTCANLVLTDGYLFNPPAGFTATASSYSRDAVGGWGTAVLPFDVDVANAEPDIFELTSADEYKVTFTKKESGTISANTPFVYKKVSGDISFEGSSNAIISTTISGYNVQDVDGTSWKIAQSMEETVIDDVATDDFLKDYDVYGISGNNFVKATKKLTMKPFRAFFLLPKAASGKARYTIEIEDGVTSVAGVDAQQKATELERFNAAGQRIYAPQRGVNLIKMSDGSVKKILVK